MATQSTIRSIKKPQPISMGTTIKLPPQNIEAEQSLLGALLIDKDAVVEVAEILKPHHFYKTEQHGNIFNAVVELFEKREPIDLVTVTEKLKQNGVLDRVGGSAYLAELVNMVPTSAHVLSYARIIAARPGMGKTSFALNIAQHVAVNAGVPVGIFSLEMSQEELVDRLLVAQADIDAWKLKTGRLDDKDFDRLSHAMGQLAEAPLFIDDTPGASLSEIRTKARRLQAEHGLKLIVVDYLQLIRGRNLENRVQEVSEISQGLKNLARELKVPV